MGPGRACHPRWYCREKEHRKGFLSRPGLQELSHSADVIRNQSDLLFSFLPKVRSFILPTFFTKKIQVTCFSCYDFFRLWGRSKEIFFKKTKAFIRKGCEGFWGEVCVALYRAYAKMSYQMVSTVIPGLCRADRNGHWLWPVAALYSYA